METSMDSETKKTVAAPTAARKTAEQWAAERGQYPEFTPGVPPANKPKKVMPPVHNKGFAKYRQAFFLHSWVQGQEMTLAQYDAAVEAAANHVYR
jgi:hypothetical protein